MKTIYYHITLKEPTILTSIEGEPNSSVSFDYIPGSVIRGTLIGRQMRMERTDTLDMTNPNTKRLFFSSSTRFLDLYPVINGKRSLPVPVSWRKKKYPSENEANKILDESFPRGEDTSTDKMKSVSGFVNYRAESDSIILYKPERILNVHTQRARRSAKEQLVYRYDALAPNQTFAGMILCEQDEDAETLYDLLKSEDRVHIGGARSAGYGRAQIDLVNSPTDNWQEVNHSLESNMTVTLLSDVILRNEFGQYTPTLDALQREFKKYGITINYGDYVALQTTLVGGFNRKWGPPLPQTRALKRGSVLNLTNVRGDEDTFRWLLWSGLGERTNEGFGQIALNWQTHSILTVQTESQTPTSNVSVQETQDGNTMWDIFGQRLQEKALDPIIFSQLFTERRYLVKGDISPTQLSNLRRRIADELRKTDPTLAFLSSFIRHIKGEEARRSKDEIRPMKAAGRQFQMARINGGSLLKWLENPDFGFDTTNFNTPRYTLRFIDAVLERAYRDRISQQKERA